MLEPDETRERWEFARLKHAPVVLDGACRRIVERTIREVCAHRGWLLHALNVRTNHVHLVATADRAPERAATEIKAWATRRLVEARLLPSGARAWVRGVSRRYLWCEEEISAACLYTLEGQGKERSAESDE